MSNIKYSNRFSKLLKLIDNNIAKLLLDIEDKNIVTIQNFIDLTDKKDTVSFTPTLKVNEILEKTPQLWITNGSRPLSHGIKNTNIYKDLGYVKPSDNAPWQPYDETIGTITSEAKSRTTDNVYVVFEQYTENSTETPLKTVLNKASLTKTIDVKKIWTSNRNTIKIGRLTRALLVSAGVQFTEKDIEDFANNFKAIYDFNSDSTNKFDIVSGKDIAKWYKGSNYVPGNGTMNNSCMANSKSKLFDIYVKNPQVKLVILYDDNGKIENGKYTSDKIKGRAIIWDATDAKLGDIKFMDRIYVANDSDFDLFKMFAELKGFWYKKKQGMDLYFKICNGVVEERARLTVKLDNNDFGFYPYLDSMAYLELDSVTLTNSMEDEDNEDRNDDAKFDRKLRCTNGSYEDKYGNIYELDEDDYAELDDDENYDNEDYSDTDSDSVINTGVTATTTLNSAVDIAREELDELGIAVDQLEETLINTDIITRTGVINRLVSSMQDVRGNNTTSNMITEVQRLIDEMQSLSDGLRQRNNS